MELKIKGLKIFFNALGEGQPLILLHGWGTDSQIWESTASALSSSGQVISFDWPGFGQSDFPSQAWSLDDYAQTLKKIIDELKLKKPTLLGHSFGGRVAIKFATTHPKAIKKLILVSSAGIKPKHGIVWWSLFLGAKVGKTVFKIPPLSFFFPKVRRFFYQTTKRTDYLNSGKLKKTFLKVIKEDLTPLLTKISVPTLIIWGEKDQEVPLKHAQILLNQIPQAKLHLLKNSGHFPFLEEPEKFVEIVKEFLKKQ